MHCHHSLLSIILQLPLQYSSPSRVYSWEERELANPEKWQTELMLPCLYGVNIPAPCEVIIVLSVVLVWDLHACIHIHVGERIQRLYICSLAYGISHTNGPESKKMTSLLLTVSCFNLSVLAMWSFNSDRRCLINLWWKTRWVCAGQPYLGLFEQAAEHTLNVTMKCFMSHVQIKDLRVKGIVARFGKYSCNYGSTVQVSCLYAKYEATGSSRLLVASH